MIATLFVGWWPQWFWEMMRTLAQVYEYVCLGVEA